MSAEETLDPDEGWQFVDEVKRAEFEDPEFAEVLARKRAMAKGESYQPEKHGPFDRKGVPRMARLAQMQPMIDVDALLARFNARAPLKLVPKSDPKVRDIRDFKNISAGDR